MIKFRIQNVMAPLIMLVLELLLQKQMLIFLTTLLFYNKAFRKFAIFITMLNFALTLLKLAIKILQSCRHCRYESNNNSGTGVIYQCTGCLYSEFESKFSFFLYLLTFAGIQLPH